MQESLPLAVAHCWLLLVLEISTRLWLHTYSDICDTGAAECAVDDIIVVGVITGAEVVTGVIDLLNVSASEDKNIRSGLLQLT